MKEDEEIDFYEDVYEMCCEATDQHLVPRNHGMYCITKDSLIPSVVESLEYLIKFWVANRGKDGIDLCGVK